MLRLRVSQPKPDTAELRTIDAYMEDIMPSKKTFEAIAAVFRQAKREIDATVDQNIALAMEGLRLSLAKNMAAALAQTNPKFDKSRFLKAAGGY